MPCTSSPRARSRSTSPASRIQLGRGDFFGELALLGGRARRADVTALGYCQLLVLADADFRTLLATDPSIHRHINQVATDRIQMNRASRARRMNLSGASELDRLEGSADPVLEIRDLSVEFVTSRGRVRALRHTGLQVPQGRIVGIVGESGSGKSTLILGALALLPGNAEVTSGEVIFAGRDVLKLSPAALRDLRGNRIAVVFQDPMTSLNPVLSIADADDRHPVPRAPDRPPREAPARGPHAAARRHPRSREPDRRLPAPVLGRHAPADRDRDGAARRPRSLDRRRADDRARRHPRGADHPSAARAAGELRGLDPVRLAQSRPDRRALRPGGGDVCRRGGGGGPGSRPVPPPAPSLHPGAPGLRAGERARGGAGARDHPGRGAGPDPGSAGLRVRAALPARLRALPAGRARLDRGGQRAAARCHLLAQG